MGEEDNKKDTRSLKGNEVKEDRLSGMLTTESHTHRKRIVMGWDL